VLTGPQRARFEADAVEVLEASSYLVGIDSNRMGFRLHGAAIRHRVGADIISEASPMGALQVPDSGALLLLMADRPTTGGYAKLATIITADIGIAGQAALGDQLRFRVCDRSEALAALLARERPLLGVEASGA
jgi:allophanate hydrolase subunit 2